ncbi:HAD family hydrolase [Tessaracoccus caeni]|uniref:HAD family hydrolase n=1 Tax=Tessaracoccus caeni TaxID=3031239 RepID=UPI0023DBCFF6|nr:beta-phosphoglucomutase family hydrolase [Tessaracoccus caeni]MDF1487831.1 beta-phosphoglucomutase family hydrolase [Tessaracoccus caeni]
MDWSSYRAVLFDLDGVLTPTAEVHMRAWGRMFNDFLSGLPGQAPYTDEDYFAYVDGKPRYDGVRDFLASRGIALPEGTPEDAPSEETVCGLGNRKNDAFNETLARDGVAPYPGSLGLVQDLAADGVAMAVVSSSKNAGPVLAAARLSDYFPVVVDGVVARAEGLPGKPAPDTYLRAAQLLGVEPAQCVVVEDAISGVQSGAAGGFGLVVGVDRGVGAEDLSAHGATLVVTDLQELRQS